MGESSHFDESSRFDLWASVRQIIYRRDCKQFWHVACVRQGECSLDYSVYARARKQFDMWASVRQIIYARVHKTTFNMWASFRQIIYQSSSNILMWATIRQIYIYIYARIRRPFLFFYGREFDRPRMQKASKQLLSYGRVIRLITYCARIRTQCWYMITRDSSVRHHCCIILLLFRACFSVVCELLYCFIVFYCYYVVVRLLTPLCIVYMYHSSQITLLCMWVRVCQNKMSKSLQPFSLYMGESSPQHSRAFANDCDPSIGEIFE